MKEIHLPSQSQQDDIDSAIKLIRELIELNQNFEGAVWFSAILSTLVQACINCGLSHQMFKQEMLDAIEHYKHWWKDDNLLPYKE